MPSNVARVTYESAAVISMQDIKTNAASADIDFILVTLVPALVWSRRGRQVQENARGVVHNHTRIPPPGAEQFDQSKIQY